MNDLSHRIVETFEFTDDLTDEALDRQGRQRPGYAATGNCIWPTGNLDP